jgi:hypothetical protein
MKDPFEHRKYHALYFILGFLISVVIVTLMGCSQGTSDSGVEVERPIYEPIEPTDPPGCWFLDNDERCEVDEPVIICCMALTPSCEACQDGVTTDEWLEYTCGADAIDAEYYGWNEELNEPIWLCQAQGIPSWYKE